MGTVTKSKAKAVKKPKTAIVAEVHGVEVPEGRHLKRRIVEMMNTGEFEGPEINAGLGCIKAGDRVVEMGTGSGTVGAVLAKNVPDLKVQSFEANPDLIDPINGLYKHNKLTRRIKVQNNVVVAAPRAPKTMDFFVRKNFLGSRLSEENNEAEAVKVAVKTLAYSKLQKDFPHNVLMLDIEGAELEFFQHADLSDVDLIIAELHPGVFGRDGMRACREYLECKGFIRDPRFSTKTVVAYKKAHRMYPVGETVEAAEPNPYARSYTGFEIDPRRETKGDIIHVDNAVMARKPNSIGWRIDATVYDSNKTPVQEAICWHGRDEPATMLRQHPRRNRIKHLPGTWLFGGVYNPHFGHFIVETLSRLWALDHIDEDIEGVLFFPVSAEFAETAPKSFDNLFSILDIDFNWKIADDFYRVDRLIIPPQGCGIKNDMSASPEYREFLRKHIREDLEPMPHEKLYISRSEITGKTGRGLVGEKRLEEYLEKEGYLIFHPQNHSLRDQLRHYLGAKYILGPDGSPFHLTSLVGNPDKKVGIIQRRISTESQAWLDQTRWFEAGEPIDLSFCETYWAPAGVKRAKLRMSGDIQFSALCKALKKEGMISKKAKWPDLTKKELEAELKNLGTIMERDMHQVYVGYQPLDDKPLMKNGKTAQVFWHDR